MGKHSKGFEIKLCDLVDSKNDIRKYFEIVEYEGEPTIVVDGRYLYDTVYVLGEDYSHEKERLKEDVTLRLSKALGKKDVDTEVENMLRLGNYNIVLHELNQENKALKEEIDRLKGNIKTKGKI